MAELPAYEAACRRAWEGAASPRAAAGALAAAMEADPAVTAAVAERWRPYLAAWSIEEWERLETR